MPSVINLEGSSDMQPQCKGEFLSVKVDDVLVKQGIAQLQHTLIGKLSLAQGDSPYDLSALFY